MKKSSPILIGVIVAAVYLGLPGNLQAIPPPPVNVPDSGSTGMLLGATIIGLGLLKWKAGGLTRFFTKSARKPH